MKHLTQGLWILAFAFFGEVLHALLPLPLPAAIYGLGLLFLTLALKLVKPERIASVAHFLVNIMAVLFVCPTVGLLGCWEVVREDLAAVCAVVALSTVLTFAAAGAVTQWLLNRKGEA